MTEYAHVGTHAENLQSGALVGPGDRVKGEDLQDGDRWLIEEGRLIPADQEPSELEGEALMQRARDLDVKGRSTMSAEELREAIAAREAEIREEG